MMTSVWVISVEDVWFLLVFSLEDDLFLGYQRRRWLIFGLSASMMTSVWDISVEDVSFLLVFSLEDEQILGYQRRE